MKAKRLIAIVRCTRLEALEAGLRALGVAGLTVTHVKGFGEYANYFTRDWVCDHAKVEIFVAEDRVEAVTAAVFDAAWTGQPGDGLVAVLPVEQVYRIREKGPADVGTL